jgi:CBS domain-containing protein
MQVNEIMSRDLTMVSADATLQDAAALMKESDVGMLPVISDGLLFGVVTDRDIVLRSVAQGLNPERDSVRTAMTANVVCCYEDDRIEDAASAMKAKQARRLVVLSRDRKPVGILSVGDLAHTSMDLQELQSLLRYVTRPPGSPDSPVRGKG